MAEQAGPCGHRPAPASLDQPETGQAVLDLLAAVERARCGSIYFDWKGRCSAGRTGQGGSTGLAGRTRRLMEWVRILALLAGVDSDLPEHGPCVVMAAGVKNILVHDRSFKGRQA